MGLLNRRKTQRQLLKEESAIGAQIFGSVPRGVTRQFFCLNESTWIWHEAWTERGHGKRSQTIRYEVHENGVLKVQEGGRYQYITGDELNNLYLAVKTYYENVTQQIYKMSPYAA